MNCRLPIALAVTMLVATLLLSPAAAQIRGGHVGGARAPRTAAPYRSGARNGHGFRGGRGYFPGWGWAYLPPPIYPDYDYGYDYGYDNGPEAAQAPPPWVVMHPEQPPAPAKPIEPLVLERQGDQWVRIGGYGQAPAAAQSTPPGAGQALHAPSQMAGETKEGPPPPKLPPAVLVFRDGHEEEIEKYTIIGPVIYTQADYWSTGSWKRKVAIADLDIPATLKLNRERGGKFSLPSGPNEVVVRP